MSDRCVTDLWFDLWLICDLFVIYLSWCVDHMLLLCQNENAVFSILYTLIYHNCTIHNLVLTNFLLGIESLPRRRFHLTLTTRSWSENQIYQVVRLLKLGAPWMGWYTDVGISISWCLHNVDMDLLKCFTTTFLPLTPSVIRNIPKTIDFNYNLAIDRNILLMHLIYMTQQIYRFTTTL